MVYVHKAKSILRKAQPTGCPESPSSSHSSDRSAACLLRFGTRSTLHSPPLANFHRNRHAIATFLPFGHILLAHMPTLNTPFLPHLISRCRFSNRLICVSTSSLCKLEFKEREVSFPFSRPSISTISAASSRSDASSSARFFSSSVALILNRVDIAHSSSVSTLSSVLRLSSRSAFSLSFSDAMASTNR